MAPAAPAAPLESWWLPARLSLPPQPPSEQGPAEGAIGGPRTCPTLPLAPVHLPVLQPGQCSGLGSVTHPPPPPVPGCAAPGQRSREGDTAPLAQACPATCSSGTPERGAPEGCLVLVCDPSRSLINTAEIPWDTRASSYPQDTCPVPAQTFTAPCSDRRSGTQQPFQPSFWVLLKGL